MDRAWVWLRRIKRAWIFRTEGVGRGILVLAFLSGTVGYWMGAPLKWTLLLLGVSFTIDMAHYWLVFNAIRCPRCAFNPTRFKNGKNIPMNTVYRKVGALVECPACSDGGAGALPTHP